MRGIKSFSTAVAAAALLAMGSVPAQAEHHAAIERIDGKPNLNGVWQVMNTANWNLEPHSAAPNPVADRLLGAIGAIPAGLGVIDGGEIPYLPEARERLEQHRANLIRHDPEAACYLPGIPRATYMPYPFQIIQGNNDDILMAYEYASANRVINMEPVGIPADRHLDGHVLRPVGRRHAGRHHAGAGPGLVKPRRARWWKA
jgi:hypothetical protein